MELDRTLRRGRFAAFSARLNLPSMRSEDFFDVFTRAAGVVGSGRRGPTVRAVSASCSVRALGTDGLPAKPLRSDSAPRLLGMCFSGLDVQAD